VTCQREETSGGHMKCRACGVAWVDKGDGWRPVTCLENQSKGTPYRRPYDAPVASLMDVSG
jgi:hypothetical protein